MKANWADLAAKAFLLPGDLVCDMSSIEKDCDHRQVLRSFINTIAWGAVSSAIAIWAMI